MILTRRAVLAGTGATLAAGVSHAQTTPDLVPGTITRVPLVLRAMPRRIAPNKAADAAVVGFGDDWSPILPRLSVGRASAFDVDNRIVEPISVAFLGLRDTEQGKRDAAALAAEQVAPNGRREFRFVPRDPGMVLIRPGLGGKASELAERGLSGLVVVDGDERPNVDVDLVAAIDDVRLSEDGTLAPASEVDRSGPGLLGNILLVNGQPSPLAATVEPEGRVRLRMANLCGARIMRLRFDRLRVWVLAVDGQPTDTFEPLKSSLPFSPAARYDLLIEAPEEGEPGAVVAEVGGGMSLVTIARGEGAPAGRAREPVAPLPANRRLPDEIKLQRAVRADVVIDGGWRPGPDGRPEPGRPLPWTINGQRGDLSAKAIASVKRDAPVVLTLVNRSAWPQPLHLQGHVFRLLHNLDDGWEPYWLDTVTVPAGQTRRIAFVAEQSGKFLLFSTVLDRLDSGLFSTIEVA